MTIIILLLGFVVVTAVGALGRSGFAALRWLGNWFHYYEFLQYNECPTDYSLLLVSCALFVWLFYWSRSDTSIRRLTFLAFRVQYSRRNKKVNNGDLLLSFVVLLSCCRFR